MQENNVACEGEMRTETVSMEEAARRLKEKDNILILCHKNPDGDTIGSAGALFWALHALKKQAAVLCSDPIPMMYSYMNIEPFTEQWRPEFVVAVDVASIQLFGENNGIQKYASNVDLCIDHHSSNAGYAYATYVDGRAAATCEVLTMLIPMMEVPLSQNVADCLYTGLATDTGCFRFSSTTVRTHLAAAKLMEAGARVDELNEILFESKSRARIEIEKRALESLEYYGENRIAVVCLTRDQIAKSGVPAAELESLTSLAREIEGVEIGITLRQQPGGSFKVSIRTTRRVDACSIARVLGGGGHARAAGCEVEGNLENVKSALLDAAEQALSELEVE